MNIRVVCPQSDLGVLREMKLIMRSPCKPALMLSDTERGRNGLRVTVASLVLPDQLGKTATASAARATTMRNVPAREPRCAYHLRRPRRAAWRRLHQVSARQVAVVVCQLPFEHQGDCREASL